MTLVGAGPGDPGLLTLRGKKALEEADVILYDHLAHPDLLGHAPSGAERIDVGKERGHPRLSQREIEAVLIDRASRGLSVVRLKGGDPFVFGRGGEEGQALEKSRYPLYSGSGGHFRDGNPCLCRTSCEPSGDKFPDCGHDRTRRSGKNSPGQHWMRSHFPTRRLLS